MEWNQLVIVLSMLLAVLLVWKELARAKRSKLTLRLLFSLLSVGSLACLLLPVTYPEKVEENDSSQVILLTEGTHRDSLDRFLAEHQLPIFTTDSSVAKDYKQLKPHFVSDLESILHSRPTTSIEVFGYGLEPYELQAIDSSLVNFHPTVLPEGVSSVDWQRSIHSGEVLTVQGNYTGSRQVKLLLTAFNNTLDSLELLPGKHAFELNAIPRHSGTAVYSLVVISGKDTLSKEPLPVNVEPVQPNKILILSAAPDFELKFLKNWLSGNGYEINMRTRISKEKFDQTFVNTSKVDLTEITGGLLKRFDLIITDHAEFGNISRSEQSAIQAAVEKDGIGLIVRADSAMKNAFYSRYFPIRQGTGEANLLVPVNIVSTRQAGVRLQEPAFGSIIGLPGTQPLLTLDKKNILVNSRLFGWGTVIVSTLQNTAQLVLEEKNKQYTELWSSVLSRAMKRKEADAEWTLPPFPVKDHPTPLALSAAGTAIPKLRVANLDLSPRQSAKLPHVWQAEFWPERSGWQELGTDLGPHQVAYIFDHQDWQNVRYAERLQNTNRFSALTKAQKIEEDRRIIIEQKPVPKLYFFLIFLLSCAFLWYETKFL